MSQGLQPLGMSNQRTSRLYHDTNDLKYSRANDRTLFDFYVPHYLLSKQPARQHYHILHLLCTNDDFQYGWTSNYIHNNPSVVSTIALLPL
jgi:hypothetical protein